MITKSNTAVANSSSPQFAEPQFSVGITERSDLILQALQLRFRVFGQDMGAQLSSACLGIDRDHFDDFCEHLVVVDEALQKVVGYSRIINNQNAKRAGGFYTESEFDLSSLIKPDKSYMEIGRTCVDPNYRSGAVIGLLWSGIGQYLLTQDIDSLMGCASVPIDAEKDIASAVLNYLYEKHSIESQHWVSPYKPFPVKENSLDGKFLTPPLLKAYLRIGAKIGGPAYWDKSFNVADAMMILERNEMNQRYLKHFLKPMSDSFSPS